MNRNIIEISTIALLSVSADICCMLPSRSSKTFWALGPVTLKQRQS